MRGNFGGVKCFIYNAGSDAFLGDHRSRERVKMYWIIAVLQTRTLLG